MSRTDREVLRHHIGKAMRFERRIDAHCPTCHGTGEACEDHFDGNECWITFSQCYCVVIFMDDEMRDRVRAAYELAQSL